MTDPELDPELLQAYRASLSMSPARQQAVWQRLQARDRSRLRPYVVAAVAVALALAVAYELGRPRIVSVAEPAPNAAEHVIERAPTHGQVQERAGSSARQTTEPELADPAIDSASPRGARPTRRPSREPVRSEAAPPPDLRAELVLLRAAKAELAAGDPEGALAQLEDHARRFPRGQLAEDRSALRIEVLCAAGKEQQGRGERHLFFDEHPHSPHRERLRNLCGGE